MARINPDSIKIKKMYKKIQCIHFFPNVSFQRLSSYTTQKQYQRKIYIFTEAATRGVLYKKVFLSILENLQEKHLCRSLCFIKVAAFRLVTLLKKDSGTDVFLWRFVKILRTRFLQNTSEWVLLSLTCIWTSCFSLEKVPEAAVCRCK